MNLVVKWYKRAVRKQRFQVRYWVVSYIFSFFFNLVERNLLRVNKFSKCCKNGIACLRKGKLHNRQLFDVPPEIEVNYRDLETELPAHLPSFKNVFLRIIDLHK